MALPVVSRFRHAFWTDLGLKGPDCQGQGQMYGNMQQMYGQGYGQCFLAEKQRSPRTNARANERTNDRVNERRQERNKEEHTKHEKRTGFTQLDTGLIPALEGC